METNSKIQLLMESDATILLISASDLREFAFAILDEAKKMAEEAEKKRKEKLLTENEVCKLLDVTHTTLWRWNRDGYLSMRKIGRRNMWAQSDIDRLTKEEGLK